MYRFAPSPTGDMHIGNLRVALFNYICAKQSGKSFFIRIEDTDKARNIEGKDREILTILDTFGISYSSLYYQSKNLKFHHQFAATLLSKGEAFSCFCTEESLNFKRESAKKNAKAYRYDGTCEKLSNGEVLNNENPFVIRMKAPKKAISFIDAIKGELSFAPENVDSFVIMRHDKSPTYNFACAVDDMLQGATFIIRGEDHVSNTPKQLHIRQSLGFSEDVTYAHLPIILNQDGKKMSKRDDESSVQWLLGEGFLPETISNYLVLLGNKTPNEVFSLEEALEWFDITQISRSPARFDLDKLRQLNREHLRLADNLKLAALLDFSGEDFGKLAKLYTEEASTLNELKPKLKAIFSPKNALKEFEKEFEMLKVAINEAPFFEEFDEFKSHLINATGLKGKSFFKPLRVLLTGAENGPELGSLYDIINPYLKEIIR
ncbi:MAG: glutamate--tRNA ligase [Campylobacteraceae bacterium]|nr:glutamate--tRNA ligase [Campylobacteraceae bacterium]